MLALIGSKEGIGHFPIGFIQKGDVVLVPDPGYPVYHIGTTFAGGTTYCMPLKKENNFLPDLKKIPASVVKKAKLMWLNYPNNPTGAAATMEFYAEAVRFAKKNNIIICHDAAYTEIYYDNQAPPSIFNIKGAKEVAIEFHSLSKTYNMTGLADWIRVRESGISIGVRQHQEQSRFRAVRRYPGSGNYRADLQPVLRGENSARYIRNAETCWCPDYRVWAGKYSFHKAGSTFGLMSRKDINPWI